MGGIDRDLLIAFGRRLRELRAEKGWSQEHLAHEADLDRSYVGGIERGSRNVSLANLGVLADALDCTLAEMLEGVTRL